MKQEYVLGIDVGSTTVKYVLCDSKTFEILESEYIPHETKQAATLYKLLFNLSVKEPEMFAKIKRSYITGSGAGPIAPTINSRFVQEVNAVVLAVEHFHPDVNSVVELGGQDAKIMHFKDQGNGKKSVQTSMNDKCASGTGATIDKCIIKVGMTQDDMGKLKFKTDKLHHVAAKCGVFAETDIVNLIKTSIPADEIMNSLADAIVMQNLTVLTRGNTLLPTVLLLGGPNTYLPFLQECWKMRIAELWDERDVEYDPEKIDELIIVPNNAQYYAAFGAIVFGEGENCTDADFSGLVALKTLTQQSGKHQGGRVDKALSEDETSLDIFKKKYTIEKFIPPVLTEKTECFIGIDGGSTSSKAAIVDRDGNLLLKVYQLSKGNPIVDTIELVEKIMEADPKGFYDVRGLGVTGYAADVLEGALNADANIVETIAHMQSAQKFCGKSVDVICDIGGQDIKVMFLEHGKMKNFKLSNQCSAGNGMLLQTMAKQFGVKIEEFADHAFAAEASPKFNYGCAVFLDTDRVNFQREGFSRDELFAGISQVLPKNVWQYVVQAPNLAQFGKHYVLQGGTQYNLAALKAQVDYIEEKVPGAIVDVHPHTGEAGAIGAALEAKDVVVRRGHATFVGLENTLKMTFTSKTDESTRCHFCDMLCSRTFIDTKTPFSDKTTRYIAGFACEKGTVESEEQLAELSKSRRGLDKTTPDLVAYEANKLFRSRFEDVDAPTPDVTVNEQQVKMTLGGWGPTFRKNITRNFVRSDDEIIARRQQTKIAIPKVLNIYTVAPFMRAYLESLDIHPQHIRFSDFSNEEMYLDGAKYGSVDPCYPAKVAQSHVHALLFNEKFSKREFDHIWFPSITHLPGYLKSTVAQTSCPIVSGTPTVIRSAFTKETNLFDKAGVHYIDDSLNFDDKVLLVEQLFKTFSPLLEMTRDENKWAVEEAWQALKENDEEIIEKGRKVLEEARDNDEVVLLLVGRPYHSDPGINHEVLSEFQALGFKSVSMRAVPKDDEFLMPYFENDIKAGHIDDCLDIRDVWPENYSTNSAQKVWAAKFAARNRNVAVLDLSSFKCGHDSPTYAIIDRIMSTSRTPHLTLHDIDANKPGGSIKIRVKTFAYTLEQYRRALIEEKGGAINALNDTTTITENKEVELI